MDLLKELTPLIEEVVRCRKEADRATVTSPYSNVEGRVHFAERMLADAVVLFAEQASRRSSGASQPPEAAGESLASEDGEDAFVSRESAMVAFRTVRRWGRAQKEAFGEAARQIAEKASKELTWNDANHIFESEKELKAAYDALASLASVYAEGKIVRQTRRRALYRASAGVDAVGMLHNLYEAHRAGVLVDGEDEEIGGEDEEIDEHGALMGEPCYCHETSVRNCPRHQNAHERIAR